MEDKLLEYTILSLLSKLERISDGIGHTPTRHKISELIVEIRRIVRESVK